MYIVVQPVLEARHATVGDHAFRPGCAGDNRTLANHIETLMRRDLQLGATEPSLEVIAPADIRNAVAVPLPDETEEERRRRDDVFFAFLDASGY
jgi:hypothetical protein